MTKALEKFLDERLPTWRYHKPPELIPDKAAIAKSLKENQKKRTVRVKSLLP